MSNNFPAPGRVLRHGSRRRRRCVAYGEPAAAPAARLVDNRTAVSALNDRASRVRRMIFPLEPNQPCDVNIDVCNRKCTCHRESRVTARPGGWS